MRQIIAAVAAGLVLVSGPLAAQSPLTLRLSDYATLPMTGSPTAGGNVGSLARVNFMREEPGGADRFFVNDLNGPLYILDKKMRTFTTYLDFNGRDDRPGLFHKLPFVAGFANGLISFQFDPDYRRNGKFYTIHLEEQEVAGSAMPEGKSAPGLNLSGYTTTPVIETPGASEREAVLIEWTDTKVSNTTFEGTARELMRVQMNQRIHPMGDLIFNPTARQGDPEWGVLYISCGDGGAGEQTSAMRQNPQRLDTMVGKVLRIVPDLSLHTGTSTVSGNGRYRIPQDNPFVNVPGARPEIWAYGLRNPHRLTWDVDPADRSNTLLASSVGLRNWESVYVIRRGANYGYSAREGNELMKPDNTRTPLPPVDEVPVLVGETITGTTTPVYPVIRYPHDQTGGDAIAGGFVYRGKVLPALRGKFIFGDISTGKVWYADYKEMLAADDKDPSTSARMIPVHLAWAAPGSDEQVYPTMTPIVLAAYKARGGTDPDLPGAGSVSGSGRADIRFAVDGNGELFVLSKVDGMIRQVVAATAK
jgi:hypothetical protein